MTHKDASDVYRDVYSYVAYLAFDADDIQMCEM